MTAHTGVDEADCARVAFIIDPVADDHLQTRESDTWNAAKMNTGFNISYPPHLTVHSYPVDLAGEGAQP